MSKVRPKLSKGILEMKFMKRTKEKVLQENEEAEGRSMYSNETTSEMLHGSSNFRIELSFSNCENYIDGRLSFGGINPEIERLMEIEEAEKDAKNRGVMKTDVSDNDMTQYYCNTNLANTINRKFEPKKKRYNNDQQPQHHNQNKKYKKANFQRPKNDY